RSALASTPRLAEARCNLGFVLLQARRRDEARQCFEQALRIEPELAPALAQLGLLAGQDGDHRTAGHLLLASAERDPSNLHVVVLAATALVRSGRPHAALRLIGALPAALGPEAESRFRGGIDALIREARSRAQRLEAGLGEAAGGEDPPENPDGWVARAEALGALGRSAEAARAWREALAAFG